MKTLRKSEKKSLIGLHLILMAIVLCCGGCREPEKALPITMMAEQYDLNEVNCSKEWMNGLEDFTGVDLQIELIPTLDYASRVERLIRSDSLPMVFTANETILAKESFSAYLNAGGFWALDGYLDDYPNLKEHIGEEIWMRSRIQGHIYGIPRLRIKPRYAALYRKDWAEALGISPPENLEEIYRMLKAFTEKDPDGNGLNDTVGLVDSWQNYGTRDWNGIQTVTTALGGPNGWEYNAEMHIMVPDFSTDNYMETLRWFNRLYREGIMDRSFSFLTAVQRQEYFIRGQAGMIFSVIDDAPELERKMQQINPEAEIAILPVIEDGIGCRVNGNVGYNGIVAFNRLGEGAVKDEKQLRYILGFYDLLCTKEGQELLTFGEEGKFHVLDEKGEKHLLYQGNGGPSLLAEEAGSCVQLMPMPLYVRTVDDSPLQQSVYDCIEERKQWVIEDDSGGLYSKTDEGIGAVLNCRIQKASIRFIMGEITESDYWDEYQVWYEEGGKSIIEEYTEAYEKVNEIE